MGPRASDTLVEVSAPAGRVTGHDMDGVGVFRGIPFAEPPVGERRFAPPVPAAAVDHIDARRFGAISLQDLDPLPRAIPGAEHNFYDLSVTTSEDCLNLNIWTPDVSGSAPVLFWIHGGAFLYGSGSGAWGEGLRHARENGIVVVSINYRLGLLGGLYLGDIEPESSNLGLQDQIEALRWVRENIASFGGDPARVTIAGQSAGAMSVASLLAAPAAHGLFRGGIVESGHLAACVDLEQARATTDRILGVLSVDRSGDVMEQLRSMSTMRLLAIQREFGIAARVFPMVKDDRILDADPLAAVAAGSAAGVALLIGTTSEEDRLFTLTGWAPEEAPIEVALRELLTEADDIEEGVRLYSSLPGTESDRQHLIATEHSWATGARILAAAQAATGSPVHHYEFAWRSTALDGRVGAAHLVDLPFAFGNLSAPGVTELLGPEAVDDPATVKLGDDMSATWAQFVSTGSPDGAALGAWPPFTADNRATMVIDRVSEVQAERITDRLDFWESRVGRSAGPLSTVGVD